MLYIGIIALLIGLGLLAGTLIKILGVSSSGGGTRPWYAAALIGAVLSIAGLVLALQGMRKPNSIEFSNLVKDTKPASPLSVLSRDDDSLSDTPSVTKEAKIATKELMINASPEVQRQLDAIEKQSKEDPNGPQYSREDFKYFEDQMQLIRNGWDQTIEETITGKPPPEKANLPKTDLWRNFEYNHDIWVGNLRTQAAKKNGPGTAEIKMRMYYVCDTLLKIQAVYHNSIVWNTPIDDQYISDLEATIEKALREVKAMEKKQGYP